VNPADSPILILSLASETLPLGRLYDIADSIISQKVAQVHGVGQVTIGGGSLPAVRIALNPTVLGHYGLGMEDVRTALGQVNSNVPKGALSGGRVRWVLNDNDQLFKAKDYRPLVIAYRNGAPVRLGDIADVEDSVENLYLAGLSNNKPCAKACSETRGRIVRTCVASLSLNTRPPALRFRRSRDGTRR
jgi:multidrug efflux pump